MKSTLNKSMLVASVFLTALIVLNGCGGGNPVNPHKPSDHGQIYMLHAAESPIEYAMTFNYDTTRTITFRAAYEGEKRSGGDISVSFSVNPALIDSFNTQHRTSYSILPDNCYQLSETTAIIPAGEKRPVR